MIERRAEHCHGATTKQLLISQICSRKYLVDEQGGRTRVHVELKNGLPGGGLHFIESPGIHACTHDKRLRQHVAAVKGIYCRLDGDRILWSVASSALITSQQGCCFDNGAEIQTFEFQTVQERVVGSSPEFPEI